MEPIDCRALTGQQLKEQFAALGLPAYRAKQVRAWLDKGVSSFDEMTDLPQALRAQLAARYALAGVRIERRLVSQRDGTVKYVFGLDDGATVESVLMPYKHGWSQCLSTQVGCRMGCRFCATGQDGYLRNLSAAEMLGQIHKAQSDRGIRVASLVLMGMGEPLDNFDEVLRFVQEVSAPGGLCIGMRHISLSTCGLVDQIYRLSSYRLQLTLSVSLHAPNDALRSQLMPVNRRWPVAELLDACRAYAKETGRRISFEYAMIAGVNDTDACAHELADRLAGMLCHVNLIPMNEGAGTGQHRSSRERIAAFGRLVARRGIPVTVRRTLGADIDASCGQLRRRHVQER